ncbi:MAG: LDH2 family malate/lactate/ureidoglycolate dehydrogenase [Yoonia sp.]|jgi:LDH2 family malate/lactate/ureidoglycolate dehydrogenase
MRMTEARAKSLTSRAFLNAGVRHDMAEDAAGMLTMAEMMGIGTHGLSRVTNYVGRLRAGGVNADALPQVTAPAPALRMIDGQSGLGAAVAYRATQAAMEAARAAGVGAAFCRGSSHLGALAPHLYLAAQAGFAAIITTNTAPMIAPAGGCQPVIGNAPLGFAMPNPGGLPVLLDIALSVAARSKVRQAAEAGAPIPQTWATDASGHPTTDAKAAMHGLMQAVGGAKGANLAFCLDLFAGGLSGAAMLTEIPNANLQPGAVANVGHMIILIDAARLMPADALSSRVSDARVMIEGSDAIDPNEAIRLPGARAIASLEKARAEGFDIPQSLADQLEGLSAN